MDSKAVKSYRTHFRSIAVVERVFDHQSLEHLDGDLTDLSELLKSAAHLPQQQPHQEVVSTEVISQRIVQLKICIRHPSTEMTLSQRRKPSKRTGIREQAEYQMHSLDESDLNCNFLYLGTSVFFLFQRAWVD